MSILLLNLQLASEQPPRNNEIPAQQGFKGFKRLLVNLGGYDGNRTSSLSGIERSENEPLSKTVEALKNGTDVPF